MRWVDNTSPTLCVRPRDGELHEIPIGSMMAVFQIGSNTLYRCEECEHEVMRKNASYRESRAKDIDAQHEAEELAAGLDEQSMRFSTSPINPFDALPPDVKAKHQRALMERE